jgi:hypothetical protein
VLRALRTSESAEKGKVGEAAEPKLSAAKRAYLEALGHVQGE